VRTFEAAGSTVELIATPGPNQAGELARAAAAKGSTLILAAGGDGTINEVINGIAGSATPFGALPSGTANVLANEIGLAGRPDRAASQLLQCVPVRIALGRLDRSDKTSRYFVLMTGVGLDALIVYKLDASLKNRFGKLAYWFAGFTHLRGKLPRFHTVVNGEAYSASFALVTRVRNYGGDFEIARRVKLTDDDFEVVIFQKDAAIEYLRFLGGVILDRLSTTDGVVIHRATSVQVMAPEDRRIFLQVDGEAVGALPATITAVPDALTLLVPPQYLSR
jgi:diacylglycerol kinase family enzyme